MAFKIGFTADHKRTRFEESVYQARQQTDAPRPSVVQVYFESRDRSWTYYNDRFDLHEGDLVYVEGKLEGVRGRVVEVSYNFRIKLADYKRVIAVADTAVHGEFYVAGSHFVTFDRAAIPAEKAALWFMAPDKPEDEYASGQDETSFPLSDLKAMKAPNPAVERGFAYFMKDMVRYLCVDGTKGRAIVEGSRAYEVNFTYCGGEVSGLTCSCFCGGSCKHEVAAMMQLKNTLELIEKNYAEVYRRSGYFAAVPKETLFSFTVDGMEMGRLTL